MTQYQNKKIFSQQKADDLTQSGSTHKEDHSATDDSMHQDSALNQSGSLHKNSNNTQSSQTNRQANSTIQDELNQAFTNSIQFEDEASFTPLGINEQETEAESGLVDIIRPKSKAAAGVVIILVAFLGLLTWQCVDDLMNAYQQGDWLSLAWSGLVASIASLGGISLIKEWRKLRRLRHQLDIQEQGEELLASHGTGKGEHFCESLAKNSGVTLENIGYDRWKQSITMNHNDADVIELYDAMVVSTQDKQAKKLVSDYSAQAAVLVAVSPLAIADMMFVAWRNITLINNLAKIYGVELGYWSRIKLLKLVFINMAAAGASELVIDASMHMISIDIAGKISTRAAQGIGVGLLTARLGIRTMALLRPLPWQKDKMVRLGDIRKQIVSKVLKLNKPE